MRGKAGRKVILEEGYSNLLDSLHRGLDKHITVSTPFDTCLEPVFFQIDHGSGHISRVCRNMEILLNSIDRVQHPPRQISDLEKFTALAAASFHDIGMHFGWSYLYPEIIEPCTAQMPSRDQCDLIRSTHGRISATWFSKLAEGKVPADFHCLNQVELGQLGDPALLNLLKYAIEAHQLSDEEMRDMARRLFDEHQTPRALFVASLLRIADALDMDRRRVPKQKIETTANKLMSDSNILLESANDFVRYLMLHYVYQAELREHANGVLDCAVVPAVPTPMLMDSDYKPLLEYLNQRYVERLKPQCSLSIDAIRSYSGLSFLQINIPWFREEPMQYLLPKGLLIPLLSLIYDSRKTLRPAMHLRNWVISRWPSSKGVADDVYPTWEEFEGEKVHAPKGALHTLEAILSINRIALLTGTGSCGKTVLAIALGRLWEKRTKAPCYFLDLKEHTRDDAGILMEMFRNFCKRRGVNELLILDNVHLNLTLAQEITDWWLEQGTASNSNVLFIARNLSRPSSNQPLPWFKSMADKTYNLVVDADALKGVSQRIAARYGRRAPSSQKTYTASLREFGNDLMAFGYALLWKCKSGRRRKLSKIGGGQYLRERFINVARRSSSGIEPFLRLCTMGSLDLSCPEDVLKGSFAELYPELSVEGLVASIDRGGFRHWQLIDRSQGEMLLEIVSDDNKVDFVATRAEKLINVCMLNAQPLAIIMQRLHGQGYDRPGEVSMFSDAVKKAHGLLETGFSLAPYSMMLATRRYDYKLDWDLFDRNELYQQLTETLSRTAPHFVAQVLKWLDVKERRTELAIRILAHLVHSDVYLPRLFMAPSDQVESFMRYLERTNHVWAGNWFPRLVDGGRYFGTLIQSPLGGLGSFLGFMERRGFKAEVETLIERMAREESFINNLLQCPADLFVPFLRFVGIRQPDVARHILDALIADNDFIDFIANTNISNRVEFLHFMKEGGFEDDAMKLTSKLAVH